jgi:hypothetical protein
MSRMAWPRTIRCRDCGIDSLDTRWAPLCPACHMNLTHDQRRAQVRPPELDPSPWVDPAVLVSRLDEALGPELA